MGVRNYLIEGVSGTGKTSVAEELSRRGFHAVHGDRELAYQGDPETGQALDGFAHEHHIWPVDQVLAITADQNAPATFFCGGSRNVARYIDQFDEIFVLTVDVATLNRRLDLRPADEFGHLPEEREIVLRVHRTGEDTPTGTTIDATAPLGQVVDDILSRCDLDFVP